jgi:hypothetical protein
MKRVTEKKKDKWITKLMKIEAMYGDLYNEIQECGIEDEQIIHFSNITCEFSESWGEIERL